MGSLLQALLIRVAASCWLWALRLGGGRPGSILGDRPGERDAFAAAARRAIAQSRPAEAPDLGAGAEGDDAAGPPETERRPPPRCSVPRDTEPPCNYLPMHARSQLGYSFGSALLLVDEAERTFIPVFIGQTEALSFKLRLEGRRYSRPLTHDLFESLLDEIGAEVTSARIHRLHGGVFFATLVITFRAGGRVLELDSRASDAVVMAVGYEAPIYVAKAVLNEAGRPLGDLHRIEHEEA